MRFLGTKMYYWQRDRNCEQQLHIIYSITYTNQDGDAEFPMLLILVLTTVTRLITNSHTLSQTIVGIVIGIISTYTQLVLLFI